MIDINKEVGHKIRSFRKAKGLTLVDLSELLYKSKATISKYERGEISIDIEVLYEIAKILDVNINQLLVYNEFKETSKLTNKRPAFFQNATRLYSYIYDGRSDELMRNVFDIIPHESDSDNDRVFMYMNIESYENYQSCENRYVGIIKHYDAITSFTMENITSTMAQASINVLSPFLDVPTKWGMFTGLSARPLMPISAKMLFSKNILQDEDKLIEILKISDQDIHSLKNYNMFSVN